MTLTHTRRAVLVALSALALALSALVALSGTAHASYPKPPGPAPTGCPSGAVCVYPDDSWHFGDPSHVFWSYGGHNIYGQYGAHRVYNNQTGGATVSACVGTNGTDCGFKLKAGDYFDYDLTPVNSFVLQP